MINTVRHSFLKQPKEASLNMLESMPLPIIISNLDGSLYFVNTALLTMLGYSKAEIFQPGIIITHPEDISENKRIRQDLLAETSVTLHSEKRYLHKTGKVIHGLLSITLVTSDDGKTKRFMSQVVDISDKKMYQNDMQLFQALVEKSNDGMAIFSAQNGKIINANKCFCENLQYSLDEIKQLSVNQIEKNIPDDFNFNRFIKSLRSKGNIVYEGIHQSKTGRLLNVEVSLGYAVLTTGEFVTAVVRDISDRKRKDDMIWFQANYDALTHLPNRYMFGDRLEQEIVKTKRNKSQMAIICLDIDNFKDINDSLGHQHGDKLLVEVANRIKQCLRKSDTVARLGGDEFAIIFNEVSDTNLIDHIAIKILTRISEPITLYIEQVFVSASIGIAVYPADGDTPEMLLKNADHAMYLVKQNSRNGYQYFTKAMHENAMLRIACVNDLHQAIRNEEFELVYQPIMDLDSQKIVKAEALLRWHHPTKGMISPAEFIPIAEESGLIIDIGKWVFNAVAKQLHSWKKTALENLTVTINMSPIQFHDRDNQVLDKWIKSLNNLGVNCQQITVEITENAIMNTNDYAEVAKKIKLLHQYGIKVALDDFGTGYSSLAHLKKLDIDTLKIDRSFVRNITQDANNHAICEAIIVMAEKINIQVIAEGIETSEDYQTLKNMGCRNGQGYYFDKALSVDQFAKNYSC